MILVVKFAETRMQWCGRGHENIPVHIPPFVIIRSPSDKAFFFATCDSDEHCSMDATVTLLYLELVTAVCLYIYTLLESTTGSLKILLRSLKVLECILDTTVATLNS